MQERHATDLIKTFGLLSYILQGLPELWQFRQVRQGNYRDLQSKRLKALVRHAYDNVDLYRHKYDQAGVHPDDIQTIDDLEKLPIITKEDLIDGFPQAILARNVKTEDWRVAATSGSTGAPIRVYKDRALLKRGCLAALLIHRIMEKQVGTKLRRGLVVIWPTSPDSLEALLAEEMTKLPRFLIRFHHRLDAKDNPHEHLRGLSRYQPDIVLTYPSVLRNMAIVARQERLATPQPKVLIVSGELLDENSKQIISSVFNGEIINCYVATEAGTIAIECGHHQGLHVNLGDVILELLQDGKPVPPRVPGSVVVTNLRNKSTPIIRYSGLGDVAVFSDKKCPCGGKLPLLEVVEGRIVDSLVLPDGRLLHPYSLTLALEHIPMVAQFQIIQESVDQVRTLIVAEKNANVSTSDEGRQLRDRVWQNLRQILGEGIDITIELVPYIPKSRERGYQTVRSLVERRG